MKEVLFATGYAGTNSTGFEQIMKALKELDFVEKEGKKVRFADKLFPLGRPA